MSIIHAPVIVRRLANGTKTLPNENVAAVKRCSHCARHRTKSDNSTTTDDVVRCRTMSCAVWTPL